MVRWLCVVLLFIAVPVMAGDWQSVDVGSKLSYTATYEKEPIKGKFRQFDTLVQTESKTNFPVALTVSVAIPSVDMNSDDINEVVRGVEWFDIADFPMAEYKASTIDKKDDTHFIAHGTLKLKGIEKKLDLPFEWKVDAQKAGLNGEVSLNRTNFSIGTGQWVSDKQIGFDVNVNFSVILHEKK